MFREFWAWLKFDPITSIGLIVMCALGGFAISSTVFVLGVGIH
jgi:hypothetical protein